MKRIEAKTGLIAFLALTAVLCSMLGVLFTQARYVQNAQSSSPVYGSEQEYIVSEQLEVSNVEEFIAAVQNGYSNIKISDEVNNPLVITSGVTDVGADLILDLNGHEIQRNNREPMLNVAEGIRMTVIDSSKSQTGALYNPVGSVLQIGGGTLTVSAGAFESGPKKSEYASGSGKSWSAGEAEGGTGGTFDGETTAVVHEKNGTAAKTVPVISPYVAEMEYSVENSNKKYWFVNGNMYFDKGKSAKAAYPFLDADTYLYYVIDDEGIVSDSILADENTADFYYSYEVVNTAGEGEAPVYVLAGENDTETVTVTVYGYYNVKDTAETNAADDRFATVRMNAGNMYVRGGSYATYFGCDTAYGLYASGGYMSVETGDFSAIEGGVCIECDYDTGAGTDEYLRVSGGTFASENGDTVRVSGGRMVATGGEFSKTSGHAPAGEDAVADNAAIHVTGGELTATGAAFTLSGSGQQGILSSAEGEGGGGTVDITSCEFTFGEGSYNTGVRAEGGNVTLTDTTIDIGSPNDVTADGYTAAAVSSTGNYGVYALSGLTLNGACSVHVKGEQSAALMAMGGDVTYNGNGKTLDLRVEMGSDTSLESTAIVASGGSVTFNGNAAVKSDGLGIAVYNTGEGGGSTRSFLQQSGTLNITTTRATALYVAGGDATFASGTDVKVNTFGDSSCSVPVGEKTGYMYDGVYVQGGSLAVAGAFTATHGGYGAAVRVNGGSAYFAGAEKEATVTKNAVGYDASLQNALYDGVRVDGGTLSVGYDNNGTSTAGKLKVVHYGIGAGVYVGSGNFTTHGASTVDVTNDLTKDQDGTQSNVTYQEGSNVSYDGVYVGGSLDAAGATFKVTHTGVENNMPTDTTFTAHQSFKMTSYAVYVAAGGEDTVTITNGTITNSVGGGIYVGGGKVTLGVENSMEHADLQIRTTGGKDDANGDDWSEWYMELNEEEKNAYAGNWPYRLSKSGGNAVDVDGGVLTVNYGIFTAKQGNGIVTRGGTATINDGYFYGNDVYGSYETQGKPKEEPIAGPGASYAFKVYGGTATVSGGRFGQQVSENGELLESYSAGSGAFVMGTDSNTLGTAKILGGTFKVAGQAGFSIYQYAEVTFGKAGASNGGPTVAGDAAAVALEKEHSTATHVTIHSGTFTSDGLVGSGDAVWYGNAAVRLTVNDGQFTGNARSGLYIDNTANADGSSQSGGSVTIGSGTFTGVQDGITYNRNVSLNISGGTFTGNDAGLKIASNRPDSGEIQLSGGEYHGSERGVNYGGNYPNLFYWRNILQDNHNVYSSVSGGSALNDWGMWDLAGDIVNNNNNKDIYVR